jgi:hypothetical protein
MFDVPEVIEETLLCLVEVLCRRNIEFVLTAGLGPDGPRPWTLARTSVIDMSVASRGRFPPVVDSDCGVSKW